MSGVFLCVSDRIIDKEGRTYIEVGKNCVLSELVEWNAYVAVCRIVESLDESCLISLVSRMCYAHFRFNLRDLLRHITLCSIVSTKMIDIE